MQNLINLEAVRLLEEVEERAMVRLSEKMNTKLRTGYVTMEQKETLIELMKQNPELKSSKFSATFTTKDAQRIWIALAEELHKIPNGAIKDWKQWRKISRRKHIYNFTWQDLCSKTKSKHSQISKYTKGTGGGPALLASEQLTSTEQQILETMNRATAISGHDNIAETEMSFEFEDVEYLDEYQQISHPESPEVVTVEAMNTNNNEATTFNMQNSSTKNQLRIVVDKGNKATNNKENKNEMVENIPMRERNTKTSNTKEHIKQKEEQPCKQTVPSHRFEKTMEYTNDLVSLTTKDQQMRKKYYRKKLKLMLRNITVKERMATALENISNVYPFLKG